MTQQYALQPRAPSTQCLHDNLPQNGAQILQLKPVKCYVITDNEEEIAVYVISISGSCIKSVLKT
jgi:hypothetical protein